MHSISTEKAPAAIGPYSQGVVVNGLLFASGQIALNPETGEIYDVVQGTFFLCGAPESSEHFTSLTEEELAKFSKEFSLSKLLHLLSFT